MNFKERIKDFATHALEKRLSTALAAGLIKTLSTETGTILAPNKNTKLRHLLLMTAAQAMTRKHIHVTDSGIVIIHSHDALKNHNH